LEAYDWRSGKEIKKDENTDQIWRETDLRVLNLDVFGNRNSRLTFFILFTSLQYNCEL
jgi:hypothetical protein